LDRVDGRNGIKMRVMLLSFKADVFERVKSGEKIYEHRRVFPDEPVKAYLYVSTPVKSIVGIMRLENKVKIESWKEKYSYDQATVTRIENYLNKHTVAMEIAEFQMTNAISLEQLRKDIPGFVVPQMYYYIEKSDLLKYLETNLVPTGDVIKHSFENIPADLICTH
jgi:predicted transcriptional regulator